MLSQTESAGAEFGSPLDYYKVKGPFPSNGTGRYSDWLITRENPNMPYVRHVPNQRRDGWIKSEMISARRPNQANG
jgi:hypothetical protein